MQRQALDELGLTEAARQLGALVQPGDVLLLQGDMGAGKTTFIRALARGMGVHAPERVRSPTFNLCLVHAGPVPLAHLDLFRLGETGEAPSGAAFEALGLADLLEGELVPPEAVIAVEWAEYWPQPPEDAVRIHLERVSPTDRALTVTACGPRAARTVGRWDRALHETCPGAEKAENT